MDTIKLNVPLKRKNKSYSATLSDDDDEDAISSSDFDEKIRVLMSCLSSSSVQETNITDSVAEVLSVMPLRSKPNQHHLTIEEAYQQWTEETKAIIVHKERIEKLMEDNHHLLST